MKRLSTLIIVALLLSSCASPKINQNLTEREMSPELREMQQGVHLASQVMEQFSSLDKLLQTVPVRTVSGNGDIPCERHDGTLWQIDGGDKNDVIECSWGSEVVIAHGGNDQIDTGWGDDALHGGDGNDTFDGSNGNKVIYGGPGNDIIESSKGNMVINGGPGDDQISTSWGNAALLFGNNWGHDTLDISCNRSVVALIFSNQIKEKDLVWSKKTLEDTRTHSKITFEGSTSCLEMVYSKEKFL